MSRFALLLSLIALLAFPAASLAAVEEEPTDDFTEEPIDDWEDEYSCKTIQEGDLVNPDQREVPCVQIIFQGQRYGTLEIKYPGGWRKIKTELVDINAPYDDETEKSLLPAVGEETQVPLMFDETGEPLALPYGKTARFQAAGNQTLNFRIQDLPQSAYKRGPIYSKRGSSKYRRIVAQNLRQVKPPAGSLLKSTLAQMFVDFHASGLSFGGMAIDYKGQSLREIDMSKASLRGDRAASKHITLHEVGHVVDFGSIPEAGDNEIYREFRKSKKYPRCVKGKPGDRCSYGEVFADNFAMWATGNRNQRSGYNVPPLTSRKKFTQLMQKWLAYAPVVPGWEDYDTVEDDFSDLEDE